MTQKAFVPLLAALLLAAPMSAAALARTRSPASTVVKVTYNKKLKASIVVDRAGRTLYMFTQDANGKDTVCTPQGPYGAECPTIWPPLTSAGVPGAGAGIKSSLLGVYRRRDGKRQVTYNGHPLYYFHGDSATPPGDKKPGDAHGQGFYGQWYVLSPNGAPIDK